MPELPEVEIVRQGLEPALLGQVIAGAEVWSPALRGPIPEGFTAAVAGKKVTAVLRRGKYIIVTLAGEAGFVLHLGMSGRVKIYPKGEPFTRAKHDHFSLATKQGTRIVYNDARRFGMLFMVRGDIWEQEAPFDVMGAEPLGNGFNADSLAAKLKGRRTPIKAALLDQGVVAGVGNIYACEALFNAGINPQKISADLTRGECEALVRTVRAVLKKAIKEGGSSLRDYRNTKGDLGYFQHHFSVYDREGKPCPGCRCNPLKTGGVKRIVQAGRSTFYCPEKQKLKKNKGNRE